MKPVFDSSLRGLLPALAAALLLAAPPAWPQEADEAATAPDTTAEPAAAEQPDVAQPEPDAPEKASEGGPRVVEAEEGSVLDDQTFEGENDDFTPSEEIPVDEPIPFPADI